MNPILPGFNPDPSAVLVDGVYYVVTSSFEYLPGLPVYRSVDLEEWSLIGHVAVREEQLGIAHSPTPGGAWAPTIRFHDGLFYVIVSAMFNARGCVVFTAESPEGPWSGGVEIPAVTGIDPDVAWDADGNAYVTYAVMGQGIRQLRVDLTTGAALEEARQLWSGTGMHAPEGPHLYQRGDDWYLLIAEGGTERGHAVSIARGPSPQGPFEGFSGNPILSARSTDSAAQNIGHADLVETVDGGTALVFLGVRPVGFTRSFSPLGRETFATGVDWVEGWPIPRPVEVGQTAADVDDVLDTSSPLEASGWIAPRRTPSEISSVDAAGRLVLAGEGTDLTNPRPVFVGRRQPHLGAQFTARVDASRGTGGIAARHTEVHWFSLEASRAADACRVVARASLAGLVHEWEVALPAGDVVLAIRSREPGSRAGGGAPETGGDRIDLVAASVDQPEQEIVVAQLDGRYWSFETTESFTGRILGLYAEDGIVSFSEVTYRGVPHG